MHLSSRRGEVKQLTPEQQFAARQWLNLWCRRWRGNLPGWRYALLVAAAKSLALHPRGSDWGRHALAVRGGKARARLVPYSREYMAYLGARGRERKKHLRKMNQGK
jgi:hypothetical protein